MEIKTKFNAGDKVVAFGFIDSTMKIGILEGTISRVTVFSDWSRNGSDPTNSIQYTVLFPQIQSTAAGTFTKNLYSEEELHTNREELLQSFGK